MSAKYLPNYLKTFRKRAGISQKELALLLGSSSGSKVSYYESDKRIPTIKTIFMLELIFNAPASQLFQGIFEDAKNDVENNAIHLLHNWKSISIPEYKIELVHSIFQDSDYLLEKLKSFDVKES